MGIQAPICGWSGNIEEFIQVNEADWLNALSTHHQIRMGELESQSQKRAWQNCFHILKIELGKLNPSLQKASIVFEYELPRERGRRPDVLVISNDYVLVFEFKDSSWYNESYMDQSKGYARDLKNYHQESHNRKVIPFLVLTKSTSPYFKIHDFIIINSSKIGDICSNLLTKSSCIETDLSSWLNSDYEPLPTLVQAATRIFNEKSLPKIQSAASAGIPETVDKLHEIALDARERNEKHLALITGVPGAGKTLVGLQFVYLTSNNENNDAIFLSGNGPLVKVLQHALENKIFVQDVHGFLKTYGGDSKKVPNEHIWIYDEAQRAWDAKQVAKKRKGHSRSEPLDFLNIGEKKSGWALMVGLIGEGQEIYIGEESGLKQWNDAIEEIPSNWTVHCPSNIAHIFTAAADVQTSDELNLNKTLRSHLAEDLHLWVNRLLDGKITEANSIAKKIQSQGFDIYCTKDLQKASKYVKNRYLNCMDKRFGIIASSQAQNLPPGLHNGYEYTQNFQPGPWYNDIPSSPKSCCQLKELATEFSCQGLELDYPIVCWGDDLCWEKDHWNAKSSRNSGAIDPEKLRVNSYRVLLTRGRDGLVVVISDKPKMNATYEILINAGVRRLE